MKTVEITYIYKPNFYICISKKNQVKYVAMCTFARHIIHWLTWRVHRGCHLSLRGCSPSPASAVPEPEEKLRGRATSLSCSLRWLERHPTPGSTELLHASPTRMNRLNYLLTTTTLASSGLWRAWGFTASVYFCVHLLTKLTLWYSVFLKRHSDRSTVRFYAFTALSFPFWCYHWHPLLVVSALEKPHFMWPGDINYETIVINENKPLSYLCENSFELRNKTAAKSRTKLH